MFRLASHCHFSSHSQLACSSHPPQLPISATTAGFAATHEKPGGKRPSFVKGLLFYDLFQFRGRRQMATIEGDIVVRDRGLGNPSALAWMPIWQTQTACGRAVWWNNKFYHTFPGPNRVIVRRAMDYITSKASCITFQEATEDTVDSSATEPTCATAS